MTHTLPALPYAYDALEPHIDTLTMTIHHTKHHQAYVDNLNKAIAGTEAENMDIISLMGSISKFPAAVRNNGGGHYNHTQFWTALQPTAGGAPVGALADAINATFGSVDALKEQMNAAIKLEPGVLSYTVVADKKDASLIYLFLSPSFLPIPNTFGSPSLVSSIELIKFFN